MGQTRCFCLCMYIGRTRRFCL